MTKKSSLPYLPTQQDAIGAIIKLLDQSRAPTVMHTFEHFNRALGVWESALRQDPMGPWLDACRGLELCLEPLSMALTILVDQAQHNYYDIIGGVYMQLGEGDRRFGQVFTPWNVARMMARMCLGDFKPPEPGQPPITFCEPCVGSGVMVLAAAEVIEERFPGTIGRGGVEFYGMDKDPCCVAMCRLNMKMHRIGRVAQRIEDLTEGQRRLLERLLGRALPTAGALVDDPVISVGDTLLQGGYALPPLTEERSAAQWGRQVGDFGVRTPAEEPQPELVVVPELVAQGLWGALEVDTATGGAGLQDPGQPEPAARERQGGRGPKQRRGRERPYAALPLFADDSSQ